MSKFDVKQMRHLASGLTLPAKVFVRELCDHIDAQEARIAELERVRSAAASVLSEEGVREYLSAYVTGCELASAVLAAGEAKCHDTF